jgi:hypothetical protein
MDEISLRPADAHDLDFLWRLHRATLRDYVEQTWSWEDTSQEGRLAIIGETDTHYLMRRPAADRA